MISPMFSLKQLCRKAACLFLILLLCFSFLSPLVFYASAWSTSNGDTVVYVTRTGSKYHFGSCGYLYSSAIRTTLLKAVMNGYSPCSRCCPPTYSGELPTKNTAAEPSTSISSSANAYGDNTYSSSNRETSSFWKDNLTFIVIFSPFVIYFLYILVVLPFCWFVEGLWKKLPPHKKKIAKIEHERQLALQKEAAEKEKQLAKIERERQLSIQKTTIKAKDDLVANLSSLSSRLASLASKNQEILVALSEEIKQSQTTLDFWLGYYGAVIASDSKVCTMNDGAYYGDTCTIYFSASSSSYHLSKCRYGGSLHSHILSPPLDKQPCKLCRPDLVDTSWMEDCQILHQQIEDFSDLIKCSPVLLSPERAISLSDQITSLKNRLEHIAVTGKGINISDGYAYSMTDYILNEWPKDAASNRGKIQQKY